MNKAPDQLFRRLGIKPDNEVLFVQALRHRSAGGRHNERLEYLGDAVLELVVTDWLFAHYPEADEGWLTRARARLVRGQTLAMLAKELELGQWLVMGTGEARSGGAFRNSVLADALEALIGATWLDQGWEVARALVLGLLQPHTEQLLSAPSVAKDAKTGLQELLQGRRLDLPDYSIVDHQGQPPEETFVAVCEIPALSLRTEGEGKSKREAEQQAAIAMLACIQSGSSV